VRHVLPRLASWIALFWFWLLIVGEWNGEQLVAAAVAASVGSAFGLYWSFSPVRGAWSVPIAIVVDFALIMWALVRSALRREIVRGAFVRRRCQIDGADARAWIGLVASYSPNAYPVGFDTDRDVVLMHDLIRRRASERPL